MKIKKIIIRQVGPIKDKEFDFTDAWKESNYDLVLFSGSNGSGKSTLLKMIASVWETIGEMLDSSNQSLIANSFFSSAPFTHPSVKYNIL